ncbi:unnamed protein product [Malassezia sympodialis ATCC 42132]|uniref:Similar to S.cerevisiae protein SSF2 (Protein required for ribosomal large subunit maturation) n=1 Tax=Malassezia sympodialis (strain ATCC 42132) TaxID=1230383 RepID=M5ENB3_MALS4|nr:uncharacterized protein MSY001_1855 [Malassezia sympodialis ATCC 42132]CCU99149.1 unnamed protein product [Malassezia sympodialis ATCC 42132]SHO78393.1 Similar to S.cerevisiae protein SSF2 (Protein required for ribosomal large subunit maturation) [Malassezia sympodialis ATCC 42132]|eukprot:XP_018740414.1 uncharacterized protein MSY001_1855 [Malassezia sympodialis ATCC 42132]
MVKRRRKTRTHKKGPISNSTADSRAPKSFVIRGGKVGKSVSALVRDVRRIMEPNTASRLQERERNKLRDYLTMAGPLGVSHMLIFNQTDAGINMRVLRCPRGPTVTFRVNKYALASDIMHSSRRPMAPGSEFTTAPLLVLNNFGGDDRHLKLLVSVFQNMFPPLHVHSMRLSQVRRVVLLNYHAETKTIDWRHYLISVRPVGVSRSVRRVIEGSTRPSAASSGSVTGHGGEHRRHGRALVNLGNATDIAEYVMRGSAATGGEDTDTSEAESEAEDMADPQNAVELAQKYLGRGNVANAQRAVRLREIGPRMELRLVKIEEGLNGSTVLYHDYVHRTAAQVAQQSREVAEKQRLASERRAEQERNVERKKQAKAQRQVTFEDDVADAPDGADEWEDEEDADDEFAYEDAAAGAPANSQAVAQDVLGSDEELFEEEDDEEERDDDDDDSDLEPIPLGESEYDLVSTGGRASRAKRRR